MSDDVVCPLCQHSESTVEDTFDVANVAREWIRVFGINIQQEMSDVSQFRLYKCAACALGFFKPENVAGSPALYEALQEFDWYYMPRKWEHDVALLDIHGCRKGMEIGCGTGDFVKRVLEDKEIAFEGCEQNPSAVKAARRKGLRVHLESAENLAQLYPGSYDVVCSFQVLEHVTRPGSFLDAASMLLRPGGKLLLGLPNAQSFLRHQFNLLDMPPHHMTRWTEDVLLHLQQLFPLKLVHVAFEPLPDYQLHDYVEAYWRALSKSWLRIPSIPAIQELLTKIVQLSGLRRFLTGQTVYVCYTRI
jgi:SAM-dependent methyltransferase